MMNEKDDIFGFGNKSNKQIAIEILDKNPNAAVVDPRLLEKHRDILEEKQNNKEKKG